MCPACRGQLRPGRKQRSLVCTVCPLIFPVEWWHEDARSGELFPSKLREAR